MKRFIMVLDPCHLGSAFRIALDSKRLNVYPGKNFAFGIIDSIHSYYQLPPSPKLTDFLI